MGGSYETVRLDVSFHIKHTYIHAHTQTLEKIDTIIDTGRLMHLYTHTHFQQIHAKRQQIDIENTHERKLTHAHIKLITLSQTHPHTHL